MIKALWLVLLAGCPALGPSDTTPPDAATDVTLEFRTIGFTDEDFDQVNAGNMVVKVIYLPSAQFQDVAAAEEIVSTRLEPGTDPVAEAGRRGTVLAVVRIGNIDLEDPTTPAMDMPPGGMSGPRGGTTPPPPAPMAGGPAMPAPMADVKLPELKKSDDKKASVPASLPTIKLPPVK